MLLHAANISKQLLVREEWWINDTVKYAFVCLELSNQEMLKWILSSYLLDHTNPNEWKDCLQCVILLCFLHCVVVLIYYSHVLNKVSCYTVLVQSCCDALQCNHSLDSVKPGSFMLAFSFVKINAIFDRFINLRVRNRNWSHVKKKQKKTQVWTI